MALAIVTRANDTIPAMSTYVVDVVMISKKDGESSVRLEG